MNQLPYLTLPYLTLPYLTLSWVPAVTRKWNMELSPTGTPPQPRSFHTAAAAGSRVVVIGGRGRDNSHFADIHLFDSGMYIHGILCTLVVQKSSVFDWDLFWVRSSF